MWQSILRKADPKKLPHCYQHLLRLCRCHRSADCGSLIAALPLPLLEDIMRLAAPLAPVELSLWRKANAMDTKTPTVPFHVFCSPSAV